MIASFREAVVRWLEGTLRADIYVSAPSLVGNRPDATLDPALAARLAATPGVAATSTSRGAFVPAPGGAVQVIALDLDPARRPRWRFREGSADGVWDAGGEAVVVSEPYANRRGARAGGVVRLRTDRGERELAVAGVFYDYGSSSGVVVMSRRTYDRYWDDRRISSLALDLVPGADPAAVMAAVRDRAVGSQDVVVRSNRALREASLLIFDRTFAITGVLRTLTVAVAFIGMLAALMALGLERAREIGVLRTLGLTPRQVWILVTAQTAKALRVLRDKVPEVLRPLCVAVLGSDGDARRQLETSIGSITERLTTETSATLATRAAALRQRRKELLTESKVLQANLREALENEYQEIAVDRKVLSDIAITEPAAFEALVVQAKKALEYLGEIEKTTAERVA